MHLPPFKDFDYALNDPKEFAAIKTCIGERFRALDHGNKGYLNKEEFGPVAESMLGANKGRTTHNRLTFPMWYMFVYGTCDVFFIGSSWDYVFCQLNHQIQWESWSICLKNKKKVSGGIQSIVG